MIVFPQKKSLSTYILVPLISYRSFLNLNQFSKTTGYIYIFFEYQNISYIYICDYVCVPSHAVKNNPIHLPSIHPGISWAPSLRCFGCFGVKKTVGCTMGGSPGGNRISDGSVSPTTNLPTKKPSIEFLGMRDKVSLKKPWLHLPQHHGTTIHHHSVSRDKVTLKTDGRWLTNTRNGSSFGIPALIVEFERVRSLLHNLLVTFWWLWWVI